MPELLGLRAAAQSASARLVGLMEAQLVEEVKMMSAQVEVEDHRCCAEQLRLLLLVEAVVVVVAGQRAVPVMVQMAARVVVLLAKPVALAVAGFPLAIMLLAVMAARVLAQGLAARLAAMEGLEMSLQGKQVALVL